MKEYKKLFALLCEIKPSTVTFEKRVSVPEIWILKHIQYMAQLEL